MPKRSGAGPVKSKLSSWKIIALRKKLGLNEAAFARQIGVNVNTLWRSERGSGHRAVCITRYSRI